MAQFDIYDTFIKYSDSKDGKERPALILDMGDTDDPIFLLAIYSYKSKFDKKFYREKFYHIQDSEYANLKKDSYIDLTFIHEANFMTLLRSTYRGHLSERDIDGLLDRLEQENI